MSNLFISHSSRDNEAAKALQTRLAEQGHRSVFLDLDPEVGIQAGVSWERTLYTKLRACRAVIALCSDNYLESQWCFAEVALARMEGKELFVLKIDPWSEDTEMPSILTEEQFIDLRDNQDEAYQRLWNGFLIKGIVAAEFRAWNPNDPPYPGLRAFSEQDAPIFFGREAEIRTGGELLNRVCRQGHPRLVMVLGSSGSGKSSLVRAGLVPQLQREREQWLVVKPFRPGAQPLRELAASLSLAFDEAGQGFGWQEIHSWLEPEDGLTPASEWELAMVGETEPTEATARDQLLKALKNIEGELSDENTKVRISVRQLRDLLHKQQAEPPEPLDSYQPPSGASSLVDLALRLRLQSGFSEASVVLVIDQFEELLGHDEDHPSSRFLVRLRAALEWEGSPLLVVGTMRSDYLGALQRSAPLRGLGFKSLSVGPVSKAGMREIIEEPARLGQVELEKGLADLLLEDTESADALPLLAFTLRAMWDRCRDDRLLTIREYQRFGGLHGGIAQVADETFRDALGQADDEAARDTLAKDLRDAFLAMARPAAEGSGWSRQPVAWNQFSKTVQPVLESFVDPQRLLVKRPDGTVEVAHEALFRSWDRLKGWLGENAEGLRLRRDVQDSASKWFQAPEDDKETYLWRGGRLARATELRQSGVLPIESEAESFLDASEGAERLQAEAEKAARERELEQARALAETQRQRADDQAAARLRQRRLSFGLAIMMVLAMGAAVFGFWQKRVADTNLYEVIARQEAQLNSLNGELAAAMLIELSLGFGQEKAIAKIHEEVLTDSTVWFSNVSFVLEQSGEHEAIRQALLKRFLTLRSVTPPPSKTEDHRLNRRIPIPGGSFLMGTRAYPENAGEQDERPQHRVTLSAFLIQEHEVTNKEYKRFSPIHPGHPDYDYGEDDFPVVGVSWHDAAAYAAWLGGRLPTEAQWEFTARGTEGRTYPWGEEPPTCDHAEFKDPGSESACGGPTPGLVKRTCELGRTPEGVCDLAGNAWEWCRNWFKAYSSEEQTDPMGPLTPVGGAKILRGGSSREDKAFALRAADRLDLFPGVRDTHIGFRVAWPESR